MQRKTPLSELSHIDLVDGSFLYAEAGRWFQSYEPGVNGGSDLGDVGDETDASDLCVRLNCAQPCESDEASRWEDLHLEEIPELAFLFVQTRQPVEVRVRDFAEHDWSNEQLVGFRLDLEGEHRVIYFVDANGREWLYCQVYRQPVAAQ